MGKECILLQSVLLIVPLMYDNYFANNYPSYNIDWLPDHKYLQQNNIDG